MYRTPHGSPARPDRRLIVPGRGVGHAVVGRSTAEEVLEHFGHDCKVSHYPSREVFQISYDYENDDDYAASRPAQAARPSAFAFEFGLLQSIVIGVFQKELATAEGVRIGMPRRAVVGRLGEPSRLVAEKAFDVLRYVELGIQLEISREDDSLTRMVIFRAPT